MKPNPKALYHPLILKHSKSPIGYGKRKDLSFSQPAYNALCGDKYQLYWEVEEGKIVEIGFYGHGCAVSKAAASVMVEALKGMSLSEAQDQVQTYLRMIREGERVAEEKFIPFAAARDFPGRTQCATLAWEAMEEALR